MTQGVLRHTLVVRHPDTQTPTPLLAGSEVPAWATDLVDQEDYEGPAKQEAPAKKAAARKSSN